MAEGRGATGSERGPTLPERLDAILRANDIRGRVPEDLDAALVGRLGTAFAVLFREFDPDVSQVALGRDMRLSGPELSDAFAAALQEAGLDVIDLGLISSDMLYFAAGRLGVPGAVLTASHNPPDYNGIKATHTGAHPLRGSADMQRIRDLALTAPATATPPAARRRGRRVRRDLLGTYAQHIRGFVDGERLAGLRVVADVANGMGALVVPATFEGLPVDLEVMYGELDGRFPNHPADPLQEANLADLAERVQQTGADVGLAFDGDADRVFFVDEQGRALSGSVTAALLAGAVLRRSPGELILYNAACSRAVPEMIAEAGGHSQRTRVGHTLIKQAMTATGAIFAGEHSGHYYFARNFCADSGVLAALVLLEELADAGVALSELRRPPERYAASGEQNFAVADPSATTEAAAMAYRAHPQDRFDGLTVDCGDWWFNLRPSNTEPLLRLNLEARSPAECTRRLAELHALLAPMTGAARSSG